MSLICPASAEILALHDEDLLNLGLQSRGKKQQKLLERKIDVLLDCELTFASQDDRQGQLKIVGWNDSTRLCGMCPFCNLLADGLQRAHDELPNWDWALDQLLEVEYTKTVCVQIRLKTLEYHKDPSACLVDGKSTSIWGVDLILIRALATLSADIAAGGSCRETNVDVAFELFADEDSPVVEELGIHRMPLESSVLSENNIRKIRSWVETCSENHIGCLTGRDANFFPARLLQIGNPDTNYDLRLIESSGTSFMSTLDKSAPPKYMALSYCWPTPDDTHKLLTTTQETLPGLMLDITSDSLPKAFRDAVRLAQALDIQYVWIDSLCIIQADEQDWQTESSKMAEIFSNAYLTVIAAAGVSCHVGFLERDATRPWCSVPIPDSNSTFAGGSFCLRYRRHRGSEKMAQIKHGRWITRSWTYQEERLARRVLMFGENKFFFDCRTMERIEGTDRCKPRPDWVDTIREKTGDNDFDPPIRTNTGQIYKRRTPYNHWQTLCSHYSRRVLTYADDKLPAISGMAKHIAKKVDSDYLAGLWREHLLQDLLWHTIDGGKRPDNFRTSHYQYRAPTWSWASKDGHLSWPDMRFFSSSESTAYCEILDAQTDLAGLDPYGAVVGGHIKVSGRVIEVEIGLGDVTPKPWVIQSGGLTTATIRPDITGVESGIRVGKKYHALLIANWQIQEAKLPIPRGLLLEKTDGSRSDGLDEFERVGIFIVYSDIATGHPSPLSAWTSSGARTIAIL